MIKIMIADDHFMLREGFKTLLGKMKGVKVIAEAENGQQLLDLVARTLPDLVIIDVQMPVMDGITATAELRRRYPALGIIALSMFIDNNTVIDMLKAGARGYLTKNTSKEELTLAITTVASGGNYFSTNTKPHVTNLIDKSDLNPYRNTEPFSLLPKEVEIIRLVCQEYTTKEIAPLVDLSKRTVDAYRLSIQEKIGATNVVGVVLYALTHGLFSLDDPGKAFRV